MTIRLLTLELEADSHHITSHHKSYSAQSCRLKIDRLCITMSMLM